MEDVKASDGIANTELLEGFVEYLLTERRYSPLTVRNYRHDISLFAEWGEATSAGFSLLSTRSEDVREWIMHLSESRSRQGKPKYGAASINSMVASVRSLYRYMRRRGIIDHDAFAAVGSLRTSSPLPKFVTEGDMEQVVGRVKQQLRSEEYVEARNALLVLMFYACGIRLAELVAIDVQHFTSDYASLRVRGKGDKERVVPIVEALRGEIKAYIDKFLSPKICKKAENALFLSKRGVRISRIDVQRSVARLLRECGVHGKLSPHTLRHTFATHLLNDGADMREIQELMGHTSLRATQIYTHNSIAQLQRAYLAAHPREESKDGGECGLKC